LKTFALNQHTIHIRRSVLYRGVMTSSSLSPSAFNGNLCLSPYAEPLGRSREQWDVPTRNAGANGISKGRTRTWVGSQSRASDNDQVCAMFSTNYLRYSNPPERYGIDNIRTLLGHKVSIEQVESSPAVRF
jgi:hypothetical protein